ncbi:hypothetical protein [Leifsonia xyli]|nr:hypothetical protein [Leifsonia xyli]
MAGFAIGILTSIERLALQTLFLMESNPTASALAFAGHHMARESDVTPAAKVSHHKFYTFSPISSIIIYNVGSSALRIRESLTRPRWIVGAGMSLALTVACTGAIPALASTSTDDTLSAVTAATSETVAAAASVAVDATGDNNAIDATLAGVDLTVPVDATDGISISGDSDAVTIELPFAEKADDAVAEKPGVVSYDNNNGSSTVPVVQKDGSVQINTLIANENAPKRYDYQLTAESEQTLHLTENGSDYLATTDGKPTLYIAAPWAKDANGSSYSHSLRGHRHDAHSVCGLHQERCLPCRR